MMRKLIIKYREFILYGIVGGGTTLINVGSYFLFTQILHVLYLISNIFAWIAGFAFAFLANKIYVFRSKSFEKHLVIKELITFFSARAMTGILDMGFLYLFVSVMEIPDPISKIIDVVISTVINYLLSKYWIFRKKDSIEVSAGQLNESEKSNSTGTKKSFTRV